MQPIRLRDIVISSDDPRATKDIAMKFADVFTKNWLRDAAMDKPLFVTAEMEDGDVTYQIDYRPPS